LIRQQKPNDSRVEVRGKKWFDMPHACFKPLNDYIPYMEWARKLPNGDSWLYTGNSERTITRLEVFLHLFPPLALNTMLFTTNNSLKIYNFDC
jgi:hypothetical protein